MLRAAPLLLLVALAGCSSDDPAPGGLSRSESKQLDEAAASIDVNAMDNREGAE